MIDCMNLKNRIAYESRMLSLKSVQFGFLDSFFDEQNDLYS